MPKRRRESHRKLRYMHLQDYEDEAALLLAEYGNHHGYVTDPPIPVDEIVEEYLKITTEIDDLRAAYPEGDVQGAIYFKKRMIVIDASLVPEDNPAMLGRYRFTLAHELGHWRLHRHLFLRNAEQRTLGDGAESPPDHVLRSHSTDPKEVQANRFAACLLMPREMVKRVWHEWRGSMEPIYLDELRARQPQILTSEILRRGGINCGQDSIDKVLLEHAARPLADRFQVSPESMRIRLEGLKLLLHKRERSLFA